MANRLVLQNLNACRTDKNVAPDITGALFSVIKKIEPYGCVAF